MVFIFIHPLQIGPRQHMRSALLCSRQPDPLFYAAGNPSPQTQKTTQQPNKLKTRQHLATLDHLTWTMKTFKPGQAVRYTAQAYSVPELFNLTERRQWKSSASEPETDCGFI